MLRVLGQADLDAKLSGHGALIFAILAAAVCIGGLGTWWRLLGRKRLMQDLPTSAAKGVALGLNELAGRAQSAAPVSSPQASVDCVWWRNTFYERKQNDDGWSKTGSKQGGPAEFLLVDDSGSIPVRPRKAKVSGEETYDGEHDGFTAASSAGDSLVGRYISAQARGSKRKRVVEEVIPVGAELYVLGTAQLPPERLDVYVGPDRRGEDPFIIGVGSESDAIYRERALAIVGGLVGLVSAGAFGVAVADGDKFGGDAPVDWSRIDRVPPALCVAAAVMIMGILSLVFVYNGLVRLRQRTDAAWSLIDVQLRRRHDILPNMVRVVESHVAHERGVQTSLTALRSSLAAELPQTATDDAVRVADRTIQAETLAVGKLLAVVEGYPTLTAARSFALMRKELVDTEDRIALARHFYNNSVLALHDRAGTAFGTAVTWFFELDLSAEFHDVSQADRRAPTISTEHAASSGAGLSTGEPSDAGVGFGRGEPATLAAAAAPPPSPHVSVPSEGHATPQNGIRRF